MTRELSPGSEQHIPSLITILDPVLHGATTIYKIN